MFGAHARSDETPQKPTDLVTSPVATADAVACTTVLFCDSNYPRQNANPLAYVFICEDPNYFSLAAAAAGACDRGDAMGCPRTRAREFGRALRVARSEIGTLRTNKRCAQAPQFIKGRPFESRASSRSPETSGRCGCARYEYVCRQRFDVRLAILPSGCCRRATSLLRAPGAAIRSPDGRAGAI